MPVLRVLWAALVGLYDETLTFLVGNLAWLALNVPCLVLLLVVLVPFVGPSTESNEAGLLWPLVGVAGLLVFVPTPGSVALYSLARVYTTREAPRMAQFWETLRATWRLASALFLVGTLVLVLMLANVYFYALNGEGWLRFVGILWLYAVLFWLSMQLYVPPLVLHVSRPRLFDVYRRAAMITLGHAFFTVGLVLALLVLLVLSFVLPPVYVIATGALVALVQAKAFRRLRLQHGDLVEDEVEAL